MLESGLAIGVNGFANGLRGGPARREDPVEDL